jgi:hypothetical protein
MISLEGTTQKFLAVKQSSPFDIDKHSYIVFYIYRKSTTVTHTKYAVHNYNSRTGEFYTGEYTTDYAHAMKEFNSRGYCQN